MNKSIDCVVCGSCVVDVLCRPVSLSAPIGKGLLRAADPMLLSGGGIVSNAGITLARMGKATAALTYVGDDAWGPVIRDLYVKNGVDVTYLETHPTEATSTTVVLIDSDGERSFFHCVGAPRAMALSHYQARLQVFARSRFMLLGYYSLLPNLQEDMPALFREIRQAGCRTALDSAGDGGDMTPLQDALPQLDVYVPSRAEAEHQTGESDPQAMIKRYRACGAPGVLGVKLGGSDGVLLSEKADSYVHLPSVSPPGDVVDTTGAGDSFYAGFLGGLLSGMSVKHAGRLGCAAAATCVTQLGGYSASTDMATLQQRAGLAD